MKKILIWSVAIALSNLVAAQSAQSEYLEAKRLFEDGRYVSAKAAFGSLVADPTFGKYCLFYFGLSAYHQEDTKTARDSWKQLWMRNPDWDQSPEVLYWLSLSSFQDTLYAEGLRYVEQLSSETGDSEIEGNFVKKYIGNLPTNRVEQLFEEFPENRFVARVLLKKLNKEPYQERDFVRISSLIEKWDFNVRDFAAVELPLVKKDTYDVAVLLPFLFESLDNTTLITQNSLVMDMYQGMLLAAQDLAKSGMPINLYPYDTKRKPEVTRKAMESPGFQGMDLILGPLYSSPNEVVNEFSKKYAINTFNPISSNTDIIGDNPYSFLIRPSYATMALKTADLAIQENQGNPYTMIFYEQSERDSLFAAVYRQKVEEAGFQVVLYQAITKDNAKTLLDTLSAKYYAYYGKSDADSLSKSGQYIRSRRVRRDEIRRMNRSETFTIPVSYDQNGNQIVYYQEKFYMAPDSIGHIVAVTRSNLFANNMISAIESRGDSTKLYGYGEWLDFTMLSFNQLDRLGVAMSNPDFVDKSTFSTRGIDARLTSQFKTNPSINHYRGYEVVWFTGKMLHLYGKYFQRGIRQDDFYEGKVFEGFRYGAANDNQIVPIVRFKNAKLEVINREHYED